MILSVNCVELLKGTAFAEKSVFAQTHVKQSVFNKNVQRIERKYFNKLNQDPSVPH